MPDVTLPALPKPEVRCGEYAGPPGEGADENYYTADQMALFAREAVIAERERCAKLAEAVDEFELAAAIRSLGE